jgi:hypothetical protein
VRTIGLGKSAENEGAGVAILIYPAGTTITENQNSGRGAQQAKK